MNLRVSETSGVPFWRQVRDELADRIRAGMLPAGAPLPSIRELAASTLVSVITIKKAYEELETMGLVRSHQGRGTFVAEHGEEASRRALHAELAVALRALVVRAAENAMSEAELAAIFKQACAEAGPGGVEAGDRANPKVPG